MALTEMYLVTTKNLDTFLNAIQTARAPEKFTNEFLKNLGFGSSNDRLFSKLLRAVGFLDDAGATQRYYEFLDQGRAKAVLAKGVQEAYEDLFALRKDAYRLEDEDVINKLRTLTQGKKSENVLRWMVNTFRALCDYADWEGLEKADKPTAAEAEVELANPGSGKGEEKPETSPMHRIAPGLHYHIEVHLPESRDTAVYEAIFVAMRKHLM